MPQSFPSGLWKPIFQGSFSSVTTVPFINLGAYRRIRASFDNISVGSGPAFGSIQFSTNNGSTYDTTSGNYVYSTLALKTNNTFSNNAGFDIATDMFSGGIQSGKTGSLEVEFTSFNKAAPLNSYLSCVYQIGSSDWNVEVNNGGHIATNARNAFRFFLTDGSLNPITFSIDNVTLEGIVG